MEQIKIHPSDNVAVEKQTGHKVALCEIAAGENVIKYGFPIGHATKPISAGERVHTDNLKTNLKDKLTYTYEERIQKTKQKPDLEKSLCFGDNLKVQETAKNEKRNRPGEILAYVRENGEIGIRNDIFIVNTVGCVNEIAKVLSEKTGAFAFPHPYGCSQLSKDHETTQLVLKGLVNHPNAGGVLVLSLGCENNNLESFRKILGPVDENRVKFLVVQECEDEIAEGIRLIRELQEYAAAKKRQPVSIRRLKVGLKCGGSDGFSGITANPLIGRFCDFLTSAGGSAVLTEVPEMFGAETLLMERSVDRDVFERQVQMINGFKDYFTAHGQEIYENPSPGNKAGGITTLEEKSLGCTQKGGTAPVVDVLSYGDTVKKPGLSLLTGPGNDMVAITNLTAAGCHLILFSTGRGTPLGAPVPTVKISSNSELFIKKKNWIDFDAGRILKNQDVTEEFISYVLSVAEGKLTKNEENGYREIAIFKDGVTL